MVHTASLKKIQDIGKKILKEIDRVCKQHNISYFLWAGTMLGAIRHKDIIPWDDDIDIVMKRKDFNHFISICPIELSEEYDYIPPDYKGRFHSLMTKIIYKNYQLRVPTEEDLVFDNARNRVSVDVFVLDPTYSGFLFSFQTIRIKMLYGYSMSHRPSIHMNQYSFIERLYVILLSSMGKRYTETQLIQMIERCVEKSKNSKEYYRITNDQIDALYRRYKQIWFDETIMLPFGDDTYPVPKSYDAILSYIYGDYMSLPPESERKPYHTENSNLK